MGKGNTQILLTWFAFSFKTSKIHNTHGRQNNNISNIFYLSQKEWYETSLISIGQCAETLSQTVLKAGSHTCLSRCATWAVDEDVFCWNNLSWMAFVFGVIMGVLWGVL